jgi:hypothetical protein
LSIAAIGPEQPSEVEMQPNDAGTNDRRSAADRTARRGSAKSERKVRTAGKKSGEPRQVRDMVLKALEQAGGVEYLEQLAHEKPTAFLTLVGKVLPLQVNAEHEIGKGLAKALAWKPPT